MCGTHVIYRTYTHAHAKGYTCTVVALWPDQLWPRHFSFKVPTNSCIDFVISFAINLNLTPLVTPLTLQVTMPTALHTHTTQRRAPCLLSRSNANLIVLLEFAQSLEYLVQSPSLMLVLTSLPRSVFMPSALLTAPWAKYEHQHTFETDTGTSDHRTLGSKRPVLFRTPSPARKVPTLTHITAHRYNTGA